MPTNEIEIHDLTHDGRGVGHRQGKACFVQGALPGERVSWSITKSQRQFDEGEIDSILRESADRVEPVCEYFGTCGGCQIQHLSYSGQVQAKQIRFKKALEHKRLEPKSWMPPMLSSSLAYRRRARLSVGKASKKSAERQIGFKHRASAQIVPIHQCPVLISELNKLLPQLPELLARISNQQRASLSEIELNFDGHIVSISLIADQSGPSTPLNSPPTAMQECDIWYGKKNSEAIAIYSAAPQQEKHAPPGFMQANAEINQAIFDQIDQLLDLQKSDYLLDLFCGSGNFSLRQAANVYQVTGVEADSQAVDQARDIAKNITNLSFRVADLFDADALKQLRPLFRKATAVILDPPRAGAEAVVSELCKSKPDRLLYISCHPATFVRDAEVLVSKGYRLESAGLLDMFPQTMHMEVIGLFVL